MLHTEQVTRDRRQLPSLHQVKSPLSRIAFALHENASYLLSLDYGMVHLRENKKDVGPERSGPCLLWWADGAGRELVAEVGTRATLLSIPKVPLIQALPPTPIGDQMRRTLTLDLDHTPMTSEPIAELLEGFGRERYSAEPGADLAATQYLTLVLVQIWRLARSDLVSLGGAPQGLSERFVLLAGQRVREHWSVERYALELKVSRDRLGSSVKRATGLSPQAYLHRLLLREAVELLTNTGTPVSLVAFRLGFVDPAYFTRFFKREIGQNPGEFRKNRTKSSNENVGSFAAWP